MTPGSTTGPGRADGDRRPGPVTPGAPLEGGPPPSGAPTPSGDSPERHPAGYGDSPERHPSDSLPRPEQESGAPTPSGDSPERHPSASPPQPEQNQDAASDTFSELQRAIADAEADQAETGDGGVAPAPAEADGSADDPSSDEFEGGIDFEAELSRSFEDIDRLQGERNEYLEQLLRTKADFENYRKRMLKQQAEQADRAAESLVEKLLEVLDVYDGARVHAEGFEQVGSTLSALLEKEGLERIDPVGSAFDPTEADAVAHEEGDEGPVVATVLRPGYRWKGRVVRPAMVKVRG